MKKELKSCQEDILEGDNDLFLIGKWVIIITDEAIFM
jgi:hypothetical protein